MDNFENASPPQESEDNASPPQESEDKVVAKCWECLKTLECTEYIVCCTGTMFHYCEKCLLELRK